MVYQTLDQRAADVVASYDRFVRMFMRDANTTPRERGEAWRSWLKHYEADLRALRDYHWPKADHESI